jgi:hypothetical protein
MRITAVHDEDISGHSPENQHDFIFRDSLCGRFCTSPDGIVSVTEDGGISFRNIWTVLRNRAT